MLSIIFTNLAELKIKVIKMNPYFFNRYGQLWKNNSHENIFYLGEKIKEEKH